MRRTVWIAPTVALAALATALLVAAPACSSKSNGTTSDDTGIDSGLADTRIAFDTTPDTAPAKDPLEGCTRDPGAGDAGFIPDGSADDPVGDASFDLDAALAGFPSGTGVLTAVITTETGETAPDGSWLREADGGLVQKKIVCKLDEKSAPISVANFVGLARGTRPSREPGTGNWQLVQFYNGLTWHRVIADFVVQGGDPNGDGTGGPGFDLPNENHAPENGGVLAMAAGTNTLADGGTEFVPSGSQFYIVVGNGPSADYNVFGNCVDKDGLPDPVAVTLSNVPTNPNNDRPKIRLHTWRVDIGRCPQ